MNSNQIDCKLIYEQIREQILTDLKILPYRPMLTIYEGEDNYGSKMYMKLKQKTAEECGIDTQIVRLATSTGGMNIWDFLDDENNIGAMSPYAILQLPATRMQKRIFEYIVDMNDVYDVDNFNFLEYAQESRRYTYEHIMNEIPATAKGVLYILSKELGNLSGKKIAVVGCRSKTVGKFISWVLTYLNATVSLYHSKSIIRDGEFENYDAVISCVGSPRLISQRHFGSKTGCICIDIGVSRVDGKTVGDFSEDIREHQRFTPYVNGMGLLTRIFLMQTVTFRALYNYANDLSSIAVGVDGFID